ncbi:FGGY family carbohydrate kinase [Pacificibacter marinus]|nr:FGGY family carbohydrate kinase [Pacificibacter marinus]
MSFFLGVDVGTGSARAGVFDAKGTLLGTYAKELETYRPKSGFAQQASTEIWDAVVDAVNGAVSAAGIDPAAVSGIGFDAKCSLVVTGDPQSVGLSIDPAGSVGSSGATQDVILWMDHRAQKDAEAIN